MYNLIDVDLEKEMDNVLHFAAKNLSETGHNTKPVLLHSFKVAMNLYLNGYSKKIVISSILHDLLEDTDLSYEELTEAYGKEIADIVEAVSFNPKIDDKLEQARQMFQNACNYGREALIVKASDLLDNINFVHLVDDEITREKLLKKYELFLSMSKEFIGNEIIYKQLNDKYSNLKGNDWTYEV